MWTCVKCGERVDWEFEVCWSCGTSVDGVEDPHFHQESDPRIQAKDRSSKPLLPPEELVTIAAFGQLAEAHLAKNRLEAEGIFVAMTGEFAATMTIWGSPVEGIKLQVAESDARRALRILNAKPLKIERLLNELDLTPDDRLGPPPQAPAWFLIRRGLLWHVVGISIFQINWLLLIGAIEILLCMPPMGLGVILTVASVGLLVVLLAWLTALGIVIVGDCQCFTAPEPCKRLIVARLWCLVSGFLMIPLGFISLSLAAVTCVSLFLAANILYVLFLRKVAIFFRADKLARGVVWFLTYWLGLWVALTAFSCVVEWNLALHYQANRQWSDRLLGPMGWLLATAVGIAVTYVWVSFLIRGIRNTIRRAMEADLV